MMGVGLEYANGPVKVGGVYHFPKDPFEVAGDTGRPAGMAVGGSYNFGVLTLAGSYQQAKNASYADGLTLICGNLV